MGVAKSIDVSILGREFTVSCTDEERQGLMDAVAYLDSKMHEIRDSGKVVGVERIAIMAALNLLFSSSQVRFILYLCLSQLVFCGVA
jgi:cell division protein ZapA